VRIVGGSVWQWNLFLIRYSDRNIRIRTILKWNQLHYTWLHSLLCDRCGDFSYFHMFPYQSCCLILRCICIRVEHLLKSLSVYLNQPSWHLVWESFHKKLSCSVFIKIEQTQGICCTKTYMHFCVPLQCAWDFSSSHATCSRKLISSTQRLKDACFILLM
jgi:hypothetical protein